MTYRLKNLTLAALVCVASLPAHAQGLKLANPILQSPVAKSTVQADFIVAVVNSEPITNNEVSREMQRTLLQLAQQNRPQPDLRSGAGAL